MRMLRYILLGLSLALAAPACGDDGDTGGGATTSDASTTTDTATSGDSGTVEGDATCTPACDDKDCGDDGCGGSCGDCEGDDACDSGVCTPPPECVPACDGKTCGDDGCGGSCGTCDDPNTICVNSNCCLPDCAGKTCGNDGCGGSCGACEADEQCTAGVCEAKTYTCPELFGLAQAADCDWSADLAGCQASITDTYQVNDETEGESLTALLACLDEKGCAVTKSKAQASCQKDDCLPETASCEVSQHGALMCFEITQCIQDAACPKDLVSGAPTAACRRQCLEQGSEAAVTFWLNLELCGVSECLGEADFDQCVTDVSGLQCVTEYSDCYDEAQQ